MMNYTDNTIECLEESIIHIYNDFKQDYTNYQYFLTLRKNLLNRQALNNQVELLSDIVAFNDALREALCEMWKFANKILSQRDTFDSKDDIEITARCYLSSTYPALHPLQNDTRQELWNALCDSGFNPLYENGVTLSMLILPRDLNESFEDFIGMTCPPANWNEGLDPVLTEDLHLINSFHNLFDHTCFALTDFIFVRDFRTEFNMEIVRGK